MCYRAPGPSTATIQYFIVLLSVLTVGCVFEAQGLPTPTPVPPLPRVKATINMVNPSPSATATKAVSQTPTIIPVPVVRTGVSCPTAITTPPELKSAPILTSTASPTPLVVVGQPNELGKILILEYHLISDEEGPWSRHYANLHQDLERLYSLGYQAISLHDLINDEINIPAGYSPVILTFDDSSPGQFRYIEENGQLRIDDNCAVGIMEEFHKKHPDFGLEATFFVLPAADPPHNLFGQEEYQEQKLRFIVERGMDIGNHTYWHQRLDQVSDDEVRRQLGLAVKTTKKAVPNYEVTALALPLHTWPTNRALAEQGHWESTVYRHRAILRNGAELTVAPNHIDFNPLELPRVRATQDQLDLWLNRLSTNPEERYISDGKPGTITFPRMLEAKLNRAAVGSKTIRVY